MQSVIGASVFWASVRSIGAPVTLGDGIEAPTPTAAAVMAVFITTNSDLYAYQLDGNAELEMTSTHPVWCETRNGWVLAGELKVGDRVRTATGSACISNIRLAQAGAMVSNLRVAGGHTFFVGEDKAWVHNCVIPGDIRGVPAWVKAKGIPPTGFQGGRTFKNREGLLPQGTIHRECALKPES